MHNHTNTHAVPKMLTLDKELCPPIKLGFNVLTMVNEGLQRLIINALMINVLNEARNANGKILQIDSIEV